MRAGIFKTAWIMFRSGLLMLDICLYGAVLGAMGKLTQEKADKKVRRWAKKILAVIKLKYRVFNPKNVSFNNHERIILMVNHASLYDIPITYVALPGCIRMVAKKELFKIPLFGRAMRAAGVPSIDRFNRQQAIKDLEIVREKMEQGMMIWICPEGSRSHDGKLQKLKKGGFILAIQAKAKIIPIGIRGATKILPKETWHFHTEQEVEVHVGEPINASDYTLENKEELIERVSADMKKLLGEK